MVALITVGFWFHVHLTVDAVMAGARNKNPIWRELRGGLGAVVLLPLWAQMQGMV